MTSIDRGETRRQEAHVARLSRLRALQELEERNLHQTARPPSCICQVLTSEQQVYFIVGYK